MKAVILAGGSGSRLWPLSNAAAPKQFLKFGGQYSLLQNTFLRVQKFAAPESILTVTGRAFSEATCAQLQEVSGQVNILSEPCARNTAPAIFCALEYFLRTSGDDIAAILPADHLVNRSDDFCRTMKAAEALAAQGFIVTLGIKPSYPESGFGYIKTAEALPNGFKVERFVEKPSVETAEKYIASGDYFWNGGIFVGKISTFMEEFRAFAPEIAALGSKCSFAGNEIDAEIFSQMPKISIDYAIMEHSARIALVQLLSDWSDLGSWKALYDLHEKDENGNVIIGKAVLHNVKNSLIYSPDRTAALADLDGVVTVSSGDVTMTCSLQQSQNVKILSENR